MSRLLKTCVSGILFTSLAAIVSTQAPAQIGPASLSRIGVVVRDAGKAAQAYKDIFQLSAVPAISTVTIELPKGSAKVKRATVTLPNAQIEVDQPEGNSGPAADFLKKYGQGIYRVGFSTAGAIEPIVAGLEQKGGKLVAGSHHAKYALVDLTPALGTAIEVYQEEPRAPAAAPAPTMSGKVVLGSTPMSHLGWSVTNADEAAKQFSDVLGVPMPTVRPFKPVDLPPGTHYNADATLRLTSWKQGNVGIELIQSVEGPTNWTEFVALRGGHLAPQHLAFPVGDKLEETIKLFQSKGARWTNGKINGTYDYLDFTDTLGIIFELNGTWGPAPAK